MSDVTRILVVLALVVRRGALSATRGGVEAWVPALVVAAGSTLLPLLRPGITPDHPWADRRRLPRQTRMKSRPRHTRQRVEPRT